MMMVILIVDGDDDGRHWDDGGQPGRPGGAHGGRRRHQGVGELFPDKRAPPAINYFEPKLYFDEIAWQKRSSEIDEWLDEKDESQWQRWMHDE